MNKPVAWVDEDVLLMAKPNDFCFMASFNKPSDDGRTTWIPLYTHPVKELTDEEIEELIWNTTDMKDFARAILRKAQENDSL